MITKEKLMTAALVVLGLAAVYYFTKSFGTIALMFVSCAAGWYLKGRYGKKVEDTIGSAVRK